MIGAAYVSRERVRLLVIDPAAGAVAARPFNALPELLAPGDLLVLNDSATLPASLPGVTERDESIEVRLSGPVDGMRATAVLFGAGDHRTRTEDRPAPPRVTAGERLRLGQEGATPLDAEVRSVSSLSPRLVELDFGVGGSERSALWNRLYRLGRPVQYAYRREPLPLWSVQTAFGGAPWAVEMPSAGRPLSWEILLALVRGGVAIASLTHAAGLSATGDPTLDAALPLPERYAIPAATALAVMNARRGGGRAIAVGTTVMRALESAAGPNGVRAGFGTATLTITPEHRAQVVDGLVSGVHTPGESHFRLLGSLVAAETLARAVQLAEREGFQAHEHGDATLVLPGALCDARAPRAA